MTAASAEALAAELDVPLGSIAVAAPGVRAIAPGAAPPSTARSIVILPGVSPARDRAVEEAIRATGATVLRADPRATSTATCAVLASPGAGFPLAALEALAAGSAVVIARTATTTELLEGAATLVDGAATQDVVDAVLELCANDAARAIAVAAGRARAADFTWERRAAGIAGVVRRSLVAT
jgi:glycosyltransferase involved in cell wall biosynthesis